MFVIYIYIYICIFIYTNDVQGSCTYPKCRKQHPVKDESNMRILREFCYAGPHCGLVKCRQGKLRHDFHTLDKYFPGLDYTHYDQVRSFVRSFCC